MDNEPTTPNVAQSPEPTEHRAAGTQETFSPEQQALVNRIVSEEKARVRRQLTEKYGDLDDLAKTKQEYEALRQSQLTEAEKLQQRLLALERERDQQAAQTRQAELNTLRLRVGQELRLPVALSETLQGEDEEAIKAHALRILDAIKTMDGGVHIPDIDGAAGAGARPGKTRSKLTPGQQSAARASRMTDDEYVAALQLLEQSARKDND